jgi:hypothetical protein
LVAKEKEWTEKCHRHCQVEFGDGEGTGEVAMRKVMLAGFLAFAYVLPEPAGAAELKQETTEAFNQYVPRIEAGNAMPSSLCGAPAKVYLADVNSI